MNEIKNLHLESFYLQGARDLFITGFDLTKFQMLQPIKDIILSYDSSKLDWRSSLRLELLKEELLKNL